MEIYSIGFTQKSASQFFNTLRANRIERLLDIRLNNTSQLAGFAKASDLPYFLREICGAAYEHQPLLAPTQDILDAYRKRKGDWDVFAEAYLNLIRDRRVESTLARDSFRNRTVLLCSEAKPDRCHRRIALEYLQKHWEGVELYHL